MTQNLLLLHIAALPSSNSMLTVDLQAIIAVLFCYWNSTLKRNLFIPRSSIAIYGQTKRLYELHQSRIQIVSSVLPIPQQQWKCDGSKVKANTLHVTPVVVAFRKDVPYCPFLIDAGTNLQRLTLVMKRQWKEGKKSEKWFASMYRWVDLQRP